MLLYLSSNLKAGLVDSAASEAGIIVRKLIGKFSLKEYVTKDMRNYSGAKYFVMDCDCVEEDADGFVLALQSFQMMFLSRIIVILSGCDRSEIYIGKLLSIGVTNIVTADTPREANDELAECLSDEGMQRYVAPAYDEPDEKSTIIKEAPVTAPEPEPIKYRWSAHNIKIAIHGSQRRSGVTVTSFNFAAWLAARGADVCYVEMNEKRVLDIILHLYEAERTDEHYSVNGIDCYHINELDRDYNFIIYDCGYVKWPVEAFKNADIRLLCGSMLPYEASAYKKAVDACDGLAFYKIALPIPEELKEFCQVAAGGDALIADASHSLFAESVNGHIYKPIIETYIAGEIKDRL